MSDRDVRMVGTLFTVLAGGMALWMWLAAAVARAYDLPSASAAISAVVSAALAAASLSFAVRPRTRPGMRVASFLLLLGIVAAFVIVLMGVLGAVALAAVAIGAGAAALVVGRRRPQGELDSTSMCV